MFSWLLPVETQETREEFQDCRFLVEIRKEKTSQKYPIYYHTAKSRLPLLITYSRHSDAHAVIRYEWTWQEKAMISAEISSGFSDYCTRTILFNQACVSFETYLGGAVTRHSLVEIYQLISYPCGDSLLVLILSCAVRTV